MWPSSSVVVAPKATLQVVLTAPCDIRHPVLLADGFVADVCADSIMIARTEQIAVRGGIPLLLFTFDGIAVHMPLLPVMHAGQDMVVAITNHEGTFARRVKLELVSRDEFERRRRRAT